MADRIKGITIQIGGDTTGLSKALRGVNSSISQTQSALNDVNRLLKLDPTNTVLVTQKQELLTQAIGQTEQKLSALESAQDQVTAAFQNGDIGRENYLAFQREIEATRAKLNQYEADLSGLQTEQDALSVGTERLEKLFRATGTEVDDYADVLGSRLVSSVKNGTANADQLRKVLDKVGQSATGGKADVKELTAALDTVDDGTAIRNLIEQFNQTGDAAQDVADDIEEIAQATKGEAMMEAVDKLSEIGDKLKEVGDSAKTAFSDTESSVTKVNAYFGETGKAAQQSADVIKAVYEEGVGESMDSVGDAVLTVKKNLGDLSDTDLQHLTEQAITLEELYGIDMNETLRGVNSLMEQYGMTAQEAMDYIVRGTQNGLDKTNELGDNLSEYAGKFAQAGYSASDYFQLLDNGLQGGAYNLNNVNDAINEVTNRLADGTIADSMSKMNEKTGELEEGTGGWGSKVESVFRQWQQGGATQKDVIDAIVEDIQNTEGQQEKLNKAALAFGTMGEDGNTKFIESLTTVGSTYDDVSGSAQNLFDQTTTPMQEMDANTRQLQQSLVPLGEQLTELANFVLPILVSAVSAISGWFETLPGPVQNVIVVLGILLTGIAALTPVILAMSVVVGALGPAFAGVSGAVSSMATFVTQTALPAIGTAFKTVFGFIISNPIALIIAAVVGLVALIGTQGDKIQSILNKVNTFLQKVFAKDWTKVFGNGLGEPLNAFFRNLSNIWDSIYTIFTGVIDFIRGVFTGDWKRAWRGVKEIFSGIFKGFEAIAKAPLNAVIALINSVIHRFNSVIDMINSVHITNPLTGKTYGFHIGKLRTLAYLAKGGILPDGGQAIVGEAGPEMLTVQGNQAMVQPLTQSNQTNHNTNLGGVSITVYGAPGQDVRELADILMDEMQRATDRKAAVFGG